jgi:serine protease Do
MKRYFFSAAAALLIAGFSASAQDTQKTPADKPGKEKKTKELKDKTKLKEYDEIIIKRKSADADKKVTIEIKDDVVIVDGKPIEEYSDDDLTVQKRSMNHFRLHSPSSPFRFEGGDWLMENDNGGGEEGPFLGVMTEGTSGGVRIERITENSAAAKAGLKHDDVITKVNDKEVFDHEQLSGALSNMKAGDKVVITYKRDGKESKTTATLGKRMMPMVNWRDMPGRDNMPPTVFNFDEHGDFDNLLELNNKPKLGIRAQDTEDGAGVKVLAVDEGSAAFKSGIRENDVITAFEGKEVNSATELARASREAKDKSSLKVQLKRDGKPQTIEVKIPKKLKTANL